MKKYFSFLMAGSFIMSVACSNPDTGEGKSDNHAASTTEAAKETNKESAAVDNETSNFMIKAAMGGMMEVQAGELALKNGGSQQVRDYGSKMVADHGKANQELMTIAKAKNVTLPTVLEGKHREHLNDLGKKSGADFDKAYMDMMVDDHKEDINLFEDAANNSKDADVKAFAAKTLPTLRTHLDLAKNANQQLKK